LVGAGHAAEQRPRFGAEGFPIAQLEKNRALVETLGRAEQTPQGQAVSIGDVDVKFLYQSRRQKSSEKPEANTRARQRRTAAGVWSRLGFAFIREIGSRPYRRITQNLGSPKNLPAEWILDFCAGWKLADINVTFARRKRTSHQAWLVRDWNCVRRIALPDFRWWRRRSGAHVVCIQRRPTRTRGGRRSLGRGLRVHCLAMRMCLRMGDGIPESLQQLAERTRSNRVTGR